MGKTSLCVIVGNVAEYIERCLRNFAPHFDEVVLVRAIGAAEPDATIEIGQRICGELGLSIVIGEYRNKPGHEDWRHVDDFAAARQMAFDAAQYPLVMWADTDDVIDIESIKRDVAEIGRQPVKVNLEGELENISSDIYGLTEETRELNFTGDESLNDISQKFPEYFGNPLELAFDADMYKVEKSIDALKEDEVDLKLDASTSITSIRKELSKEIDLSLSSSKGSDILGTISSAVDAIKSAVLSLEKKLPQPSIGY